MRLMLLPRDIFRMLPRSIALQDTPVAMIDKRAAIDGARATAPIDYRDVRIAGRSARSARNGVVHIVRAQQAFELLLASKARLCRLGDQSQSQCR